MLHRKDGANSSANSSFSAPPDIPSTEQYKPVSPHDSGARAQGGNNGASDTFDIYHARAASYSSQTDAHDDIEDTLTTPVPASVPAANARSVPQLYYHLQQQEQQQQRIGSSQLIRDAGQEQRDALLLPQPYDRPSSPPVSAVTTTTTAESASHPHIPHLSPPRSPSTTQWQLSSPQDRALTEHATTSHGAVFEYASEAVNTLEKQYGDALQRLRTMHRLYDRLDEQNRTLEAEVVRLRGVNDILAKGVAFNVYSSVRQVKHEMKLLKQYVAVLCTDFSNSLEALQRVVAEDVPRLVGRSFSCTALLPYGTQGRLRSMETRVSIGGNLNQQDPFGLPPPLPRNSAAELQLYQPNYWWNAMSPQPLRPPSMQAAAEGEEDHQEPPLQEQQQHLPGANEVNRAVDYYSCESLGQSRNSQLQQDGDGHSQGTVSFQAYRRTQMALAEAQRRVVQLEQQNSNQQADYEARVAQLKVAHRAREARLEEELAMLKRIEPIVVESAVPQTTGVMPSTSIDVNALTQLIANLQQQRPSQTPQPSQFDVAGGCRQEERGSDDENKDDGMVNSRDSHSATNDDGSNSSNANDPRESDVDEDYEFYYGNGDPRHSYGRTNRRVLQAVVLGRDRPHTVSGDDGRLHLPDRYSPTAAARRAERARQVLEKAVETTHKPRSLAYDRLVDRHDNVARRARHAASQAVAPRGLSQQKRDELLRSGGHQSRHRSVDLRNVDPALLQLVLKQLFLNGNTHNVSRGQTYPSKAARARGAAAAETTSRVDRLAQGMWAEEMLKERHCM